MIMANDAPYTRPSFEDALAAWKALLKQRGFSDNLLWLFDENLCFEKDAARPEGFRLGFQVGFTPPPAEAEKIAYEHFQEFEHPIVFYRVGSAGVKSLCLVLGDNWFANKTEAEGFLLQQNWRILFRPGGADSIEEIYDKQRWQNRILRDRPLHDLDFCMTLQAVHETLAHGRVLTAYDRYALRFLHLWRRFLGHSE
jgi:hypothetical protein